MRTAAVLAVTEIEIRFAPEGDGTKDGAVTDSYVMRSRSGTVRRIAREHAFEKLSALSGRECR